MKSRSHKLESGKHINARELYDASKVEGGIDKLKSSGRPLTSSAIMRKNAGGINW